MGRTKIFEPELEIENICTWIKNYFIDNGPRSKAVIGISGGKDSTVAAMLLVKALGAKRVLGVMMPQSTQTDIDDSRKVCECLGINSVEIDIGPACSALYRRIDEAWDFDHQCEKLPVVGTNTPSRIRMATLYAMAGIVGGRVVNTCNWSEDFVGYSTKYGDLAGDFAILSRYAVREVITMGCILAKELTKLHERYFRGTVGELAERFKALTPSEKKGEFVMTIEGCSEEEAFWKEMSVEEHVEHYISLGLSKMDACKAAARDRGVGKGEIYRIVNN